jgi:glyoxylase-like metal-dependent hydrolase (beta-lactamase superfamily II)
MADTELHLFEAGTLTVRHQMVYLKGEFHEITIPIPFFLIEHPEGNVLFDGGMQLEACRDPQSYFSEHILEVMKPRVSEDQHVLTQLDRAGIDPGSIRYVIQSHLHFDHAGAVGHLPEAEFVVHRSELEYAYDPHWFVDGYKRSDFDRPGVRWREIDLDEENPELDLYGDGALRVIFTPGHSPGLLSLLVDLPGGAVILAGDAADAYDHYHHRAMPGLYVDGAAVVRSIDRLHELEAENGVRLVIFGHDMDQWRTLKQAGT